MSIDTLNKGISVLMSVTGDGESISDLRIEEGDLTDVNETTLDATLFIPGQIADELPSNETRLVVTTFRVASLFPSRTIIETNQIQSDFNRTVNSRIISASIGNNRLENLPEPVQLSFVILSPVSDQYKMK